jgi:hypothetical protein
MHNVCRWLKNFEEISPAVDFPCFRHVGCHGKAVMFGIFRTVDIQFFLAYAPDAVRKMKSVIGLAVKLPAEGLLGSF